MGSYQGWLVAPVTTAPVPGTSTDSAARLRIGADGVVMGGGLS
jgi:hypothetical protein